MRGGSLCFCFCKPHCVFSMPFSALDLALYAQGAIKSFPRMLSIAVHVKTVNIFPLAEFTRKFLQQMLSVQWNCFLVCSVCNEIVSSYAQCAIKSFPCMLNMRSACYNFSKITLKPQIKLRISTIKNPNFEKPFRNPSNRTQVNIKKNKNLGYLSKKIWFRVCSVTVKMFQLRNSSENWRKISEIFIRKFTKGI